MELSLQPHNWIEDLNKYQASIEIYDLIKQNTPEGKEEAINLSINEQVLCRFTGYICRIKENASPNVEESYLLKMKNSLEGVSSVSGQKGVIYVKTLTGKTVEI